MSDGGRRVTRGRPADAPPGRVREFATLWAQFEAAVSGRSSVVMVTGDPGIGKTHLLDAIATRAETVGALVLRGSASDAEGMPPYLPFLNAFGRYIRTADSTVLQRQTGSMAAILAAIFPELRERLSALPFTYPMPLEQARLRLFEAMSLFISAITSTAPLVLLLDDVQWADGATLDLLAHLARNAVEARLLVVGAYRAGEDIGNPALRRTLNELVRLRMVTTISVGPLAPDAIEILAKRLLDGPLDSRAIAVLHAQSEGNPFFAEELLWGWSEAEILHCVDGMWLITPGHTYPTPSSITGAIGQRLSRHDPRVLELLRVASIIGRSFELSTLADVAGEDGDRVEEQLTYACRVRLLRTDGHGVFTFGHDKIREALYSEVTSVRRKRLHGFIGRVFELRLTSDEQTSPMLADLAFHFTLSGDRERGATYATQAAERAVSTFAYEDAVHQYQVALGLLDATDGRRGPLLLGLGEASILATALDQAATAFAAAETWADHAHESEVAARAAYGVGRVHWRQQLFIQARSAFERALELLEGGPSTVAVEVLVDLSSLLATSLNRVHEGIIHGRLALDMARRLGQAHLEAAASRTVGNLLVRANDIPAGLPLLEEARERAEAVDDLVEAAECCSCLALAYNWSGQIRKSFEMIDRRLAFAERCNDMYQLRHAYTWAAARPLFVGDWERVDEMLDRARVVTERLSNPEAIAFLANVRGGIAVVRGDYATAEALFEQSTVLFRQAGPTVLVWFLGPLILTKARLGKVREARVLMDESEELVAANPPGTIACGDALVYLAQAAVLLQDRERAARYYPHLIPFAGLSIDCLVHRVLGGLATLLGDLLTARSHLEMAERVARREQFVSELVWTLEARAHLELAAGGSGSAARARQLLGEARTESSRFGMVGDARRLRSQLRALPTQPGERLREAVPAGLSQRELAVLRLLAAGKSNREIAEALSLSEKTISNHLTTIFSKADVQNRAAATAFAFRHGLV